MTNDYIRDGVGVTDPVLADSGATYTPGISERRGGVTSYVHSGLKNADAQSGSSQAISASRKYDAWGNVRSSTGTWQGPFGHAGGFGYQSSDRSGLQLLGHRYYDPETGRFLTRDPIKDGRNWHAYGGGLNNPITGADPNGLKFQIQFGAGVTAEQKLIFLAAWIMFLSTDEGKELVNRLEESQMVERIIIEGGTGSVTYQAAGSVPTTVFIRVGDANLEYLTSDGNTYAQFLLAQCIAHELGHAVGGFIGLSSEPGNIKKWENPVATALGNPARNPNYGSTGNTRPSAAPLPPHKFGITPKGMPIIRS